MRDGMSGIRMTTFALSVYELSTLGLYSCLGHCWTFWDRTLQMGMSFQNDLLQIRMTILAFSIYKLSAFAKIRVQVMNPELYGIDSWNIIVVYILSQFCIANKMDNSCSLFFWVICPWLRFPSVPLLLNLMGLIP